MVRTPLPVNRRAHQVLLTAWLVLQALGASAQTPPIAQHDNLTGHACPLPWGLVTAWHMVEDIEPGRYLLVDRHALSSPRRHSALDAALYPLPKGMDPLEAAVGAREGIVVRIQGFALTGVPSPEAVEGTIVGRFGYHWVVDGGTGPGSSGGCVLTEEGRVVGIVVAARATGKYPKLSWLTVVIPVGLLGPEWFPESAP